MKVKPEDVKRLREMTGAGILDCKKALEEANGDFEKAKEILRVKGLAKAEKKAGRETKEGIVKTFLSEDKRRGVILELLCETDFVAQNSEFRKLSDLIARALINLEEGEGDFNKVKELKVEGVSLDELIKGYIAKLGENIRLNRFYVMVAKEGKLFAYKHGDRIGTLLEYSSQKDGEEVAKEVAMQIVAMAPDFVKREDVPEEVLNREREILKKQALSEGKPPHVVDKIVEGRLRKFFEERVLMEQPAIRDDKKKFKDFLRGLDESFKVLRFVRFSL